MVRNPFLVVALVTLPFLVGCSRIYVEPDIPCPDRPTLSAIPEDLQLQMPEDAVWIVAQNQLALKAYAKKLEARAGCEQD